MEGGASVSCDGDGVWPEIKGVGSVVAQHSPSDVSLRGKHVECLATAEGARDAVHRKDGGVLLLQLLDEILLSFSELGTHELAEYLTKVMGVTDNDEALLRGETYL